LNVPLTPTPQETTIANLYDLDTPHPDPLPQGEREENLKNLPPHRGEGLTPQANEKNPLEGKEKYQSNSIRHEPMKKSGLCPPKKTVNHITS